MASGDRRAFLLAAGLGSAGAAGCGPTITNEANPIGPPPDPATDRKETGPERADRLKEETRVLREAKGWNQEGRPVRPS